MNCVVLSIVGARTEVRTGATATMADPTMLCNVEVIEALEMLIT
jgi:hypothetical protein